MKRANAICRLRPRASLTTFSFLYEETFVRIVTATSVPSAKIDLFLACEMAAFHILKGDFPARNKGVAVISAKNHKRQRRKRRSVTAKREKSQTPKV